MVFAVQQLRIYAANRREKFAPPAGSSALDRHNIHAHSAALLFGSRADGAGFDEALRSSIRYARPFRFSCKAVGSGACIAKRKACQA